MEFDIKYNYYKCIEGLVDIVKWKKYSSGKDLIKSKNWLSYL